MNAEVSVTLKTLENSFRVFTAVSGQLEASYRSLEQRIGQFQRQLQPPREQSPAIIKANSHLQQVFAALPAGVIVLDGRGRISQANPAAQQLLSVILEGRLWRDVVAQAFAPAADDGRDVSLADGRKVHIATCPLGNEPGQVLLLTDVTETRQLQDRVTHLQRLGAIGEMAAALAHQIRTPLSASLLYASQLKNPNLTPDQFCRAVDAVVGQLRQLDTLVGDMLLFSRRRYVGDQTVDVTALVGELAQMLQPAISAGAVDFSLRNCPASALVAGNSRVLLSALLNLANNACQALPRGGRLEVVCDCDTPGVVDIHVIDNGQGIAPDIRSRIFDPFFTTRETGTGLGLAVVRVVARAHGGDVWLNTGRDQGTEFIMRLPLVTGAQQHAVVKGGVQ